ncbi:hypothetical protein PVAND_003463 [Polypedilum vanderplanki]|uniref:Uncharacterized protein n=1 Tax=Polypedilum vanderplanki TaxID=319348 RepID=A0A9J6BV60_POLVA|nr:hypothetical protein PVAND_003463 [Polypedilum vanderplanki]
MIIKNPTLLNLVILTGSLWTIVLSNAESDKWSWPTSVKSQQVSVADNRKDIFYERFDDNPKSERIRVPTSYYDSGSNRRPHSQQYQVKESSTNKPKPLSDEFSNEYSGENYGNAGNRFPPALNFPNRFGPQAQQHSGDYPSQFGYQGPYNPQFGLGGGFGTYPQQFPGAFGQYPGQQFPGNYYGGYQNPANGILVGPGGPTGIFGRPRYPHYGGSFGYPQQFGHFGSFDGQHNNIGPYNPAAAGGFANPYNQQFGGGQFYGGGPLYDSQSKNSALKNKIEKSAD